MKEFKFTPQVNDEDESDISKLNKPIYIFGKDVRRIPCFRNSYICGICCGFGAGLVSFLATSKVTFSTHIAFASIWLGVFGYWIPCRLQYENDLLQSEKMKSELGITKIISSKNEV